jgi:hypothetical protein
MISNLLPWGTFLSKGRRPEDISSEIIHLLKDLIYEIGSPQVSLQLLIHLFLHNTLFEPSVNLKVYDSYDEVVGSKTAYIHKDVMTSLGLLDTNDDNIIEVETNDKKTVANVLELRDVDKRKNNIIRLGFMTRMNLDLQDAQDYKTVTVRKAMKAIPADKVILKSYPGQRPFGGYYLKRKLQGTPLCLADTVVATTTPNNDFGWLVFIIDTIEWKEEYKKDFGGVVVVTPETSFEEIISEAEIVG